MFLELCCASDSELAAAKVKHSVAIRVISSPEDLQLVSTRRVLHRLLRICKTYDVVVNIWVSIASRRRGREDLKSGRKKFKIASRQPTHCEE